MNATHRAEADWPAAARTVVNHIDREVNALAEIPAAIESLKSLTEPNARHAVGARYEFCISNLRSILANSGDSKPRVLAAIVEKIEQLTSFTNFGPGSALFSNSRGLYVLGPLPQVLGPWPQVLPPVVQEMDVEMEVEMEVELEVDTGQLFAKEE